MTKKRIEDPKSLKSFQWQRFIRSPDPDLLEKLYVPALQRAVKYDRSCAYFSSRVLTVAARGFGGFIENILADEGKIKKPAARLLVNEQLDRSDLEHLLMTGDHSALIRKLLKDFKTPRGALEKNRLDMLAWLVASGWLEVRVGVMHRTGGIAHAKYGIITDRYGDRVAFMGSDNETGKALVENYEELEVQGSWADKEFVEYYENRFEMLWTNKDPHVAVLDLPEAVHQKLIEIAPAHPPEEMLEDRSSLIAAMAWHFIDVASYLPRGEFACDATAMVDPWPHQRSVVEDTSKAFPAGRLLCDEVGMGKTIEAILILRRLLNGRGVKRALLLIPAGLLQQWQEELREKGGLIVPKWEDGYLQVPGSKKQKLEPDEALRENDVILLSREWARLDGNREVVLNSPAWDIVLLDEAHAARRSSPKEREFNSANLLLRLVREMQLRKRTRGILLLSATPMQTQPWEPWDLLGTLGIGGLWMVEFSDIRRYYAGIHKLEKGLITIPEARDLAPLIVQDVNFPAPPNGAVMTDAKSLANSLAVIPGSKRSLYQRWLRMGSPLGRRMHRNTRETLRRYYAKGLISSIPPNRIVDDEIFTYKDSAEQDCYDEIETYIDERYAQLEEEKPGKGFVMTIYRRRAASSPFALRRSLMRRAEKLDRVIHKQTFDTWLNLIEEQIDPRDLADEGIEEAVDEGLPTSPKVAEHEMAKINELLEKLDRLGLTDSKLDVFWPVLEKSKSDGRSVLVFTEYTDTMEYLRKNLRPTFGSTLGCYSGKGGEIWNGDAWRLVSKADITERLFSGELRILLCTDAASEGLNLQAASAIINYDLPWNPSKVEQRIGRIDRIGQTQKDIPVFNLFLDNSVDMRVYQVLRMRCGLFEHFVGKMQPVLALARTALRRRLTSEDKQGLINELNYRADQVEDDAVVAGIYLEADVEDIESVAPPVKREDLEDALRLLSEAEGKLKIKKKRNSNTWQIQGLGKYRSVTTNREDLERDEKILPLTVGSEIVTQIKDKLPLQSRAPILIVDRSDGPYRCSEARWIKGTKIIKVKTYDQLLNLIKTWDGSPASPTSIQQARVDAEKMIKKRLNQIRSEQLKSEQQALDRQIEAARFRLLREVGRTLRCIGSGDLNQIFRQQIREESDSKGRYSRALRLLGDYPTWPQDELKKFDVFVDGLANDQRMGRIRLGMEIEAALNDPRWMAKDITDSIR